MKSVIRSIVLSLVLAIMVVRALPSQSSDAARILRGLSNHGRTGTRPYVTAGDRAYLIGTQDGKFPDMGGHLEGEMGGLWLHPIKLIDGFAAELTDVATKEHVALTESAEFINYPYANLFRYAPVLGGLKVERFQLSPNGQPGVIVRYTISNATDRKRELRFQFAVKTDIRPVWYSEHLDISDAPDTVSWSSQSGVFIARDTGHPWFCVWGAASPARGHRVDNPAPIVTKGAGVTAASAYDVAVAAHGTSTLTLIIAGSTNGREQALAAFRYIGSHRATLLTQQVAHYASLIDRARVHIPDQRLQDVYSWVRVNLEWLVRDVPGMGRGLGGGLMEYPWWFPDMYSVQALTATGDVDLAKQFLRLLQTQSMKANGNGRIVHELTTNGGVVNPGNTQETAQFVSAVANVVDWSGDVSFAREMYPAMTMALHWLLVDRDQNKDLFPEGYGIMEVLGLNAEVIDVAVYTQQALAATAHIATILEKPNNAKRYAALASDLRARINEKFWIEDERTYADFYGTRSQAISAADGSIKQIRLKGDSALTRSDSSSIRYYEQLKQKMSGMPDTSRGWLTNRNWVISTPMEIGIAPRDRAIRALDQIRAKDVGEYGPYLSAVEKQAMMTISTGVQAVSEASYGRSDNALWYMGKIADTFDRTLPGSASEMMPDYGCFTISWTSYGIVVPIIQQFLGVQPDAVHKTVSFEPRLPTGWDNVSVEQLPVGANSITFARSKTSKGVEYTIDAKDGGWSFVLKEPETAGAKYYVNGAPVAYSANGFRMQGRSNRVLIVTSGERTTGS